MLKVEWRVLGGLGAFLAPLVALYWFTSYEHAGSVLLLFFSLSLVFLGAYLAWAARGRPPRPEDRADAVPADVAGEDVGWFATGALWPLVVGLSATLVGAGMVFSVWLALPGLALLGAALVAAVYASRRPH